MTFSKNLITLGTGRVISARTDASGETSVVVKSETALVLKVIPDGCRQPSVGQKTVSYADECFILDAGKIHKRGEYEYDPD